MTVATNRHHSPPKMCPCCGGNTEYLGQVPFRIDVAKHTNHHIPVMKNLHTADEDSLPVQEMIYNIDVYRCADCAHLSFYDLDFSLGKDGGQSWRGGND